jgi:glutamine amidotransferase
MKVSLLDYGAGNLHSLSKALELGGAEVVTTASWDEALATDALILPGVGSFGAAVRALDGFQDRVREALASGLPCLGICLGMQLLFSSSDEGEGEGIGLIPGRVVRLEAATVPQMGWNDVVPAGNRGPDPLFPDGTGLTAYYANSFVCAPEDWTTILAWSDVDGTRFPASVRAHNTWGVQFHPEKSSAPGLGLIRRFLDQVGPGSGTPAPTEGGGA